MSTGGPPEREELFERARSYAADPSRWSEADRTWSEVVTAYREPAAVDGPANRRDRQQLGRALWRHGMLLSAMGRPADAMTSGRSAVAVFDAVLQEITSETPEPTAAPVDEARAELVIALVDLGETAFAGGDPAARLETLNQAVTTGLVAGPPPQAGPRVRRAMGTAYHNQATALLHRFATQPGAAEPPTEAAMAASRATELRQKLIDPADPLTIWELANTYALYAQCLVMIGDLDRAEMVIRGGRTAASALGPTAAQIVAKLDAAQAMVTAARRGR